MKNSILTGIGSVCLMHPGIRGEASFLPHYVEIQDFPVWALGSIFITHIFTSSITWVKGSARYFVTDPTADKWICDHWPLPVIDNMFTYSTIHFWDYKFDQALQNCPKICCTFFSHYSFSCYENQCYYLTNFPFESFCNCHYKLWNICSQ